MLDVLPIGVIAKDLSQSCPRCFINHTYNVLRQASEHRRAACGIWRHVFTLLDKLAQQFRFESLLWTTKSINDTYISHQYTRQIPHSICKQAKTAL